MYKYKHYEWDLTEEEQKKARCITKSIREAKIALAVSERGENALERLARDQFKQYFFHDVIERLGLKLSNGGNRKFKNRDNVFGTFGISEDCTKLTSLRLEE